MRSLQRLAVLVLLLAAHAVHAVPGRDDVARARVHYDLGSGLYQLHRYDDAIREFTAGYALARRPLFLLNIAHCYELLARYELAYDNVKRYLEEENPRAPERAAAVELMKKLEQEIADAPAPVEPPPVVVDTPVAAHVVEARPAPPPRRHHGLAIGLGVGAAALVTAGLVIGLVVAFPRRTAPSSTLGSASFAP